MSRLGVLRGRREHRQLPSPGSEHRGLRRAHLPHALVTRTPMWRQRAGTRRLGERGRGPRPHPGRPPVGEVLRSGIPCRRRTASRSEVGRDQVARLMAMSGMWGDERRRGVTTRETPWCRRRPRPRSAGLSVGTSARTQSLGPDLRPHHRRDGRRLSPRRHEVQDRRLAGRLGDDGPDGPPSPLGGPAPPGCVPRRSLVLLRSGPLRCREGGPTVREATSLAEIGAVPSVGQPGERRHRTPESLNAFCEAELVFGPGRWGGRDVSHLEAVTASSFTWWRNPDSRLSRRPSLGDGSPRLRAGRRGRGPHRKRGRTPRYGGSREARVNRRMSRQGSERKTGLRREGKVVRRWAGPGQ